MDLHQTVAPYFHEAVCDALKNQGVLAEPPTEFYLVNLLVDFTQNAQVGQEPLALTLARSLEASPKARAQALKEIGDTSLYLSGFFADHLTGRSVSIDYYMTMGGAAYGQLAKMPEPAAPARGRLTNAFGELAGKFEQFAEVLGEVRRRSHIASSTNVLRLCEEWVRSKGEWLEQRLRATGLFSNESFGANKLVH